MSHSHTGDYKPETQDNIYGIEPRDYSHIKADSPPTLHEGRVHSNDAGEELTSTDAILNQRGKRYGLFVNQATLSQKLKTEFDNHVREYGQPELYTASISEAIEMILHKLARIANGDPTYLDNFVDISGYSELIVKELKGETI